MKKQNLCFVDFGLSHISVALCEIGNNKLLDVIFFDTKNINVPEHRPNSLVLYEDHFYKLITLIDKAEQETKTNISNIIFLIKDKSIQHFYTKQTLTFPNIQKIYQSHIEKLYHSSVNDFCKKNGQNYNITDMIQYNFLVDNQLVKNPYKMKCKKIELYVSIFAIKKVSTKFFCEYLEKCKLHTEHFLSSTNGLYFLTKEITAKGMYLIVDIGAYGVEYFVVNNGNIILKNTLLIGGIDITRDIFNILGIYKQDAESIKKMLTYQNKVFFNEKKYTIQTFNNLSVSQISNILSEAEEIANARFNEITICLLEDIMKHFTKQVHFDSVLLFGEGSKYKNSVKIFQQIFNTDIRIIKTNIIENDEILKNFFNKKDDVKYNKILTQKNIPLLGAISFYISNLEKYERLKKGFFYSIPKKISCLLKELLY